MLAQITVSAATILTASIAGAVAIAKKLLPAKALPKPDLVTRAEFHQAIDATRDRIGAGYLALSDKIDLNHTQVLATLDRQSATFEHRLDSLEAGLARLDERAKHTSAAA